MSVLSEFGYYMCAKANFEWLGKGEQLFLVKFSLELCLST